MSQINCQHFDPPQLLRLVRQETFEPGQSQSEAASYVMPSSDVLGFVIHCTILEILPYYERSD